MTPLREARLIKDLQAKIFELKQSLERAEHRLLQQQGRESSAVREVELEKELEMANERFSALKAEKALLEKSNKALRTQLTYLGINHDNKVAMKESIIDASQVESAARRADKMKELESLLVKAKKDKDKAVRLIILLIGKERMSEFLKEHAGSPDILDALVETFGGKVGASSDTPSHNRSGMLRKSPPVSPMNMKMSKSPRGGGFLGPGPKIGGGDEDRYIELLKSDLKKIA